MKRKIITLILLMLFSILLLSCSYNKVITGKISHVSGNTVEVKGRRFKVFTDTLKIGQTVTFTSVRRNDKRINSRKTN